MSEVELLQLENQKLRAANASFEETIEVLLAERTELRTTRGSDEEPVYYASKLKKHFHRPNCQWAKYILASQNLVEFGSHREAIEAGYKPCKTCRA